MQQDNDYLQAIQKHYPGALPAEAAVERLLNLLKNRLGLDPNQIVAADSICCDDLNTIEYPPSAYKMLGPFKMGGLNGFPFAGLTGMGAFAHHVPENGATFLFYAPHIGVTREGSAGEVLRPGQSKASTCCGAAKAALGKLQNDAITPGTVSDIDYQMNTIEQIFLAQKDRILNASSPILEATDVMYEAIEERINTLVSQTKFVSRYVILMGAVFINASTDMGAFYSIRRLEIIDTWSGEKQDHLQSLSA